ncbi:MAG TPA: DUF445 family protein [Bacilli bacterium]
MNDLVFIGISVAVAAIIGGVTNHLAIKMLFHPRKPVIFMNKRLPFTPGLIPKRKQEIGMSLGHVVAEYLVTPQGLAALLKRAEFRQKTQADALRLFKKWSGEQAVIARTLAEWIGEQRWSDWKDSAARGLESAFQGLVRHIWEERGLARKRLPDVVQGWHEGRKEALADRATEYVAATFAAFLQSAEADRLLRKLVPKMLERTGGLLGSLAGMFLDEEKLLTKVKAALLEMLKAQTFQTSLRHAVMREMEKLEQLEISALLEKVAGIDSVYLLLQRLAGKESWRLRIEEWTGCTFAEALAPAQNVAERLIPHLVDIALTMLAANAERLMRAIQLPQLVEKEVSRFPVERLEDLILSVSGKEFRAITWLGALLGGIIGLLQSLLFLFYHVSIP